MQLEEDDDGIFVPPRLSQRAKGKGKAKRPRSPSPALVLDEEDEEDDPMVAKAMSFFGAAPPSANKGRPSKSAAAPRSASRSISPAVAGPSRPRSSAIKSTSKKRKQPESDGPAFQIDDASEDEELVKANRRVRRKEPQEVLDEEVFDPVSAPRKLKTGRRPEEERFDRSTSAGKMKAKKVKRKKEIDRDDDSEVERPRKKRSKLDKPSPKKRRNRLPSLTPSDSSADSDISIQSFGNRKRAARNFYAQGRNHTGRVAWTEMEEQALMKAMSELPCKWSAIIKLYGPEGTSSTIFKNRTVVSLKDKAVNIKAGLIRAGRKVPYFLEGGQWLLSRLLDFLLTSTLIQSPSRRRRSEGHEFRLAS